MTGDKLRELRARLAQVQRELDGIRNDLREGDLVGGREEDDGKPGILGLLDRMSGEEPGDEGFVTHSGPCKGHVGGAPAGVETAGKPQPAWLPTQPPARSGEGFALRCLRP